MRKSLLVALVLMFAGCSGKSPDSLVLTDDTTAYTLVCNEGWPACYSGAEKTCGEAGFEELDRSTDGTVTSAGHLARMHSIEGKRDDHVYSENPRPVVFNRTLTFRCSDPQKSRVPR